MPQSRQHILICQPSNLPTFKLFAILASAPLVALRYFGRTPGSTLEGRKKELLFLQASKPMLIF